MAQSRPGSHAKAFLDTLFSSSSRNAASSSALTPTFKPHTPSSLASSASASASEDGGVERDASALPSSSIDGAESDSDGSGSLLATSPSFSSSFKAAQLSMQTLSQSHSQSQSSSRRTSASVTDYWSELLAILNNDQMDEEDRIDKVHSTLAAALYAIEGVVSPSSRIDGLVLDLMHRHREDRYPTGATFSPMPLQSPLRRPASIRSTSSRQWTPSRPAFSASGSFTMATDPAMLSTPQQPSSPLVASTPATLASASPRPHPGVIGSGSPRASPRPWNRTLSTLSTTGMAPLSSQSAGAALSSPVGPSSRPVSPSSFGSPRLNIAATEFKPRTASSSNLAAAGSAANLTPTRPTFLMTRSPSSNASTTNLALANKSHATADDDDEQDEFSPFASVKSMQSQQTWNGLSDYENDIGGGGGSHASWSEVNWAQPPSLDMLMEGKDEEGVGEAATTLTPFDMLYSILITGTKAGSSEWSPEQVDEALVLHQYDVEKTLNAIWENDGKPLGDGTRSSMSGYIARPAAALAGGSASPRFTPATAAVKAGVNILSRDALALRSGGRTSAPITSTKGAPAQAQPPAVSAGGVGANRVCRYYLAGECRRSDCKFSHDLENRTVCRYWLKGQCAHDPCNFLHDYDALNQLASGIASGLQVEDGMGVQGGDTVQTPVRDEFPELARPGVAKGSYAAATAAVGGSSAESRNRWAATVQKRAPTDALSQVMQKDSSTGIISVHSKAGPAARTHTASAKPGKGGNGGVSRSAVSGRLALRAPLLLPTLATGKQAAASYAAHRGESLTLAERRNQLLVRAADAFGRQDVSAARKLSKEASSVNSQYENEARTASRDLLLDRMAELASRVRDDAGTSASAHLSDEAGVRSSRGKPAGAGLGIHLGAVRRTSLPANCANLSVDERSEALLDLHALHAHEAVEHTETFLLALETELFHGLAFLAVGKESHTTKSTHRRRAHLASALKHFLATYAYPFAECDGVLVVDHLTHS